MPAVDWPVVLAEVAGRAPAGSNRAIKVARHPDGGASIRVMPVGEFTLSYTASEWDAFVAGVRNGEFDLPTKAQPGA